MDVKTLRSLLASQNPGMTALLAISGDDGDELLAYMNTHSSWDEVVLALDIICAVHGLALDSATDTLIKIIRSREFGKHVVDGLKSLLYVRDWTEAIEGQVCKALLTLKTLSASGHVFDVSFIDVVKGVCRQLAENANSEKVKKVVESLTCDSASAADNAKSRLRKLTLVPSNGKGGYFNKPEACDLKTAASSGDTFQYLEASYLLMREDFIGDVRSDRRFGSYESCHNYGRATLAGMSHHQGKLDF